MKKRARKKHDEGWSPEDASTSIFRGPWFFRNSLSPRLRLLAARIAGGIENVDVSKERDWPVSRARGSPSLRSSPVSRVSSPTLQSRCTSLFFTLLSSHFVAQFHLVVSCQLNRKRRARGKNSGDGGATVGRKILCAESSFRLAITWPREREREKNIHIYIYRERGRTATPLMMLLHRWDFWRETKNITPYNRGVERLALIISDEKSKRTLSLPGAERNEKCRILREVCRWRKRERERERERGTVGNSGRRAL